MMESKPRNSRAANAAFVVGWGLFVATAVFAAEVLRAVGGLPKGWEGIVTLSGIGMFGSLCYWFSPLWLLVLGGWLVAHIRGRVWIRESLRWSFGLLFVTWAVASVGLWLARSHGLKLVF
jgi:hypothetical protein